VTRQTNKEIYDRLRSVETKITKLCATVENVNVNQTALLKKHEETLYGNGKPGLNTRIDRIEQIEQNRKWSLRVLWSAMVGVFARIGYDLFK
jgi:hypothetical protein